MDALWSDLQYSVRGLRKSPIVTLVATLTLTLGIGASTAIYSIVYAVFFRPLPYTSSNRLVRVWEEHPGGHTAAGNRWLSNRTYAAWLHTGRTIDGIGGYSTYDYTVGSDGGGERVIGSPLSPDVFRLLEAAPALGRLLVEGDSEDGVELVAVLSDQFWRGHYGANPHVVGERLFVDGKPLTIVGVTGAGFFFPDRRVQFWVPYQIAPVSDQGTTVFTALGRLRPDHTPAEAEAEGTAAARSTPRPASTELWFGKGDPVVVHARSLAADVTVGVRPALRLLAGAVVLLLLIVCANLGNLLLMRGVVRQREFAVRMAIGASRGRLARQLLTESFVLALAGGTGGLLLASWLVRLLPSVAPSQFPRLNDVTVNGAVLGGAALASLMTALLSGLAPALRGSGIQVLASLRSGDGGTGEGFRGRHAAQWRDLLLIAESAMAVALLIAAALLAHSFQKLTNVDGGYTATRVLTAQVTLPIGAPPERTVQLIEAVLERVRASPTVVAAGVGNMAPFTKMTAVVSFPVPDAQDASRPMARVGWNIVTPGYAEALGLRLHAGRVFDDADVQAGVRPMIVNEQFVREYLHNGPAVGRRFAELVPSADEHVATEIIGVVGNVLKDGNDQQPQPEVYFVHGSPGRRVVRWVNVVVRTNNNPTDLSATLRRLVREIDQTAVVGDVDSLTHTFSVSVATPRFSLDVLGGVAVFALLLAAVGIYGVLAYSVSRRQRDLAVRVALGASHIELIRTVMYDGMRVTVFGIAVGVVGALAATRILEGALFGVSPLDPAAYTAGPAVLMLAALTACVLPAYRAARVDPMVALRAD